LTIKSISFYPIFLKIKVDYTLLLSHFFTHQRKLEKKLWNCLQELIN